jgi:hypothetical protein
MLLASASARPELLAQHFPGLQSTPAPRPAAPFEFVHQRLGAFGREATERRLPELLAEAEALIAERRALIVTHLPCVEATRQALPGVAVRYHGGTVGDDDFGDVEVARPVGKREAPGGDLPRPKILKAIPRQKTGFPSIVDINALCRVERELPLLKTLKDAILGAKSQVSGECRFSRLPHRGRPA